LTFSIVACCPKTRQLGVAVASSSPAVAARCAHVRAHVGAVASQNITDPRLGPKLLDLMAYGFSAAESLEQLRRGEANLEYRQLLLVDVLPRTALGKISRYELSRRSGPDERSGSDDRRRGTGKAGPPDAHP